MMVRRSPSALTMLLLLLFLLPIVWATDDLVEFLFQHQQICGNPFSDAQWVPVLDLCEVKCAEDREICVENDEMKQRCSKLPDQCVSAWLAEKSANVRSSGVVVVTRRPPPPPSKAQRARVPPMTTALVSRNNARSKKQNAKTEQNEEESAKMEPKRELKLEMTNSSARRRAPIAKTKKTEKEMKTTKKPTEVRERKRTKAEEKERGRKGPKHIIQSVIELLRQE